jgi:hypothetical protein
MEIIDDYPDEPKYAELRETEGILMKGSKKVFEFEDG